MWLSVAEGPADNLLFMDSRIAMGVVIAVAIGCGAKPALNDAGAGGGGASGSTGGGAAGGSGGGGAGGSGGGTGSGNTGGSTGSQPCTPAAWQIEAIPGTTAARYPSIAFDSDGNLQAAFESGPDVVHAK